MIINELSGLHPYFEVCPNAIVLGSWWFDIMTAAVLMSRCVWFPMQSVMAGTYTGGIEVPANRLVCAGKFIGKTGNVFIKYTIGGRPGNELQELVRAFIRTQLRPNNAERLMAADKLVEIYLEAKEASRKYTKDFQGAVQVNAGS